jgi:hypothetical protein
MPRRRPVSAGDTGIAAADDGRMSETASTGAHKWSAKQLDPAVMHAYARDRRSRRSVAVWEPHAGS